MCDFQQQGCSSVIKESMAGNKLTIAVPRKHLALMSHAFTLDFKWADNPTNLLDIISLSTTGDTAPNRRFRYRFRWKK